MSRRRAHSTTRWWAAAAVILAVVAALLVSGCEASGRTSPAPEVTTQAATEAATEPTTEPTTEPKAGCAIPARFAGADLERLPLAKKKIALTFDAGSGAQGVRPILRTLARHDVPGTFFLTGGFVRTFHKLAARIGRLHLVGNHTDTHLDLTRLTDRQVTRQIDRAEAAILSATGQDPRRFFRFPYGARDARRISLVNDRCYVAFRWTVDTLGWEGTSEGISVESVVDRVLAAARPGAIVLMHVGANPKDHSTLDADALPTVIHRLRQRGYTFVPLSAAMSAAP